jgi:hypothetical protein
MAALSAHRESRDSSIGQVRWWIAAVNNAGEPARVVATG